MFKAGIQSKAVLDLAFRSFVQRALTLKTKDAVGDGTAGSLIGIFQGIDTQFLYRQNKTGSRAII